MTATNKTSLAGRLTGPLALAAISAGLFAAPLLPEIPREFQASLLTGARVFAILATGWLTGTLIDWWLSRALQRADISVADNLAARKLQTRVRMLRRLIAVLVAILTIATALMALPGARELSLSLFASAGIAGLVIGIAAQPVLSNLIAGLQIALTQPIRIDDAVVVEGEWGWIEEIGLFHVTVRLWDDRRLMTPLSYFNQTPFQNWTKEAAAITGSIFWSVDYRAPIPEMRRKLEEFCRASAHWDGRVCVLQVTGAVGDSLELRALASAKTSPAAWDLRCEIREKMVVWLQQYHPDALPVRRAEAVLHSEGPTAET